MEGNKNVILNATKWSATSNIFRKLITPITNMVLARLLTPYAFGVVASISIVISFAQIFSDAGFQKYIVQHEFENDEELEKSATVAFWANLFFSMILWFFIFILRKELAEFVGSPGYGMHLAVAALAIPITAFSSMQQAIFKRKFDFRTLFIPQMLNALVPLIITVPLAITLRNCWALIIGTLIANISDAVVLMVLCKWKPICYFCLSIFRKMFSFSAWTLIETISIWLTSNVDIFILGRELNTHYLGMYKTAITTVNQLTAIITSTMVPVIFSALSRYQADRTKFESTLFDFQKYSGLFLFPISVGIFVFSDFITIVLLGRQWIEIQSFIGLLGLMQGFTVVVCNYASEVYRSLGQPKISLLAQILYIILIIPFVKWGVSEGFKQLCLIRALLMISFVIIHLLILKIKFDFNIGKMITNFGQPIIASILMGCFGAIVHNSFNGILWNVICILACIVVYFFISLLLPETRNVIVNCINFVKNRGRENG